ncbi:MAG: hypothetical protein IJK67_00175 [Bacilli bacterium]|nr:hypothetical protein [Bacilli bacterium]
MNHKVNSVADLYTSSVELYNKVVIGTNDTSAASIAKNLREGIEALKNSWQGMDAGTQINNVVTVYNAVVKIKNLLSSLTVETSKIAADYRAIQRANGANNLEELMKIKEDAPDTVMPEYSDSRDTVNITQDAVNGKNKVDAANTGMDGFITDVKRYFDEIMSNWTMGPKRDEAKQSFDEFISKAPAYKNLLAEVSQSITTALQNYGM